MLGTPSTATDPKKQVAGKVTAISGSRKYTLFIRHGICWDAFFSILMQTLPELANLQEEEYDAVVVQYKHLGSSIWKPLCGDEDLAEVLSLEGLLVRMAPEDEFHSGGESEAEQHASSSYDSEDDSVQSTQTKIYYTRID